ncbi:type I methionyl aminopeptidase [Candidatus Legionella polyplacis]|uniref:type I methionyl aminopeptidase n=1 Tax=Candidatus Legionella polyplacis TaxID=2005262 RepID=UPI000C1EE930|nr:type I methionyl aminopeptidase [Candidatus Legionella polyplacis]ATW01997.1 type I methionyl aminopeptidase [Candidatus Legionella polyplacis]
MKINIKNNQEIQKMRIAGKIAASVLDMIEPYIKEGVTTNEINNLCHNYIVNTQKAIPAPLGYFGFPKSICTSINNVVCHGIPNNKVLKNGDIINIDIAIIKNGYHADTSKMFLIGTTSEKAKNIVQTSYECLLIGICQVKPNVHLGNIGYAIQKHAEKYQYSIVKEYCGHGIGKYFHEQPQILHYGVPGTKEILKKGMTFTIEPMINAGKPDTKILKDQWTVVTKDNSLSAQWEHTILVTDNGFEILTLRKKEKEIIKKYYNTIDKSIDFI